MNTKEVIHKILKTYPYAKIINKTTILIKDITIIITDYIRLKYMVIDYYNLPETLSHKEWKKLEQKLQDCALKPYIKYYKTEKINQQQGKFEEKHYLIYDIPLTENVNEIKKCIRYLQEEFSKTLLSIPRQ